jgi:molybdate transport system ATP-binding protein
LSLYVDIERNFPDFSLKVQFEGQRDVLALLGASGCGKSLILKCIAGIEKPDRGRIVINDTVVFDSAKRINLPPQKRYVGFLFQNYALFPTKTVWNNISCVIKKPKDERQTIVQDIIQKFQLDGIKNLYPRQISGGQQQRAALARILVSAPQILMLDEPFSALDTQLRWHLEQEVAVVLSDFGGTTLFVSHDRDEVYRISDKIAVMDNGRIDCKDGKAEIFDRPKTVMAARMTGCKNISKAEKVSDFAVRAVDWGIVLKTADKVSDNIKYIGVRANHFLPYAGKIGFADEAVSADRAGENRFLCHLSHIIEEPFENAYIFSFNTVGGAKLQFQRSKQLGCPLEDKRLTLCIPPNKILLLE